MPTQNELDNFGGPLSHAVLELFLFFHLTSPLLVFMGDLCMHQVSLLLNMFPSFLFGYVSTVGWSVFYLIITP